MHARGVVHLDLRQRKNILIAGEQPWLIDFANAWKGKLTAKLRAVDESALLKFKERNWPHLVTDADREAIKSHKFLRKFWIFSPAAERPMKNVRALAAQVLTAPRRSSSTRPWRRSAAPRFSRRDRALLTTLVYGATRWRRELDWLIDRCAERVHPEIRQHLRVALFQIRHLDKIPRHAAVNERSSSQRA
jgi:hypothetical protein